MMPSDNNHDIIDNSLVNSTNSELLEYLLFGDKENIGARIQKNIIYEMREIVKKEVYQDISQLILWALIHEIQEIKGKEKTFNVLARMEKVEKEMEGLKRENLALSEIVNKKLNDLSEQIAKITPSLEK